jgi:hypothetical protein
MLREKIRDGIETVRATVREASRDDIVAALGLERKSTALASVLTAAGVLVAGVALGTGVALAAAPRSGRELRRSISQKLTSWAMRLRAANDASARELQRVVRSRIAADSMRPKPTDAAPLPTRRLSEPATASVAAVG